MGNVVAPRLRGYYHILLRSSVYFSDALYVSRSATFFLVNSFLFSSKAWFEVVLTDESQFQPLRTHETSNPITCPGWHRVCPPGEFPLNPPPWRDLSSELFHPGFLYIALFRSGTRLRSAGPCSGQGLTTNLMFQSRGCPITCRPKLASPPMVCSRMPWTEACLQ